ncbi:MAG: AAA family ATPase, partial [Caldilineaceae bacterium]
MEDLAIRLLGAPIVEIDGLPHTFDRRKNLALLSYLAANAGRHSRDTLAALLWPDYRQESARSNLRRTLSLLNNELGGDWLDVQRNSVELPRRDDVEVDVDRFLSAIAECSRHGHSSSDVCPRCADPLASAAGLYRDDFLTGFTLADSDAFDEWQLLQTEHLRREMQSVLERLVRCHVERGDLAAALSFAHRRLIFDSLDENAHRSLMRFYAWQGDRTAALRQYEECAQLLADELGVEPEAETDVLRNAIASGTLEPPPASAESQPAVSPVASPTEEVPKTGAKAQLPETAHAGELRLVTVLCAGLAVPPDIDADPAQYAGRLPQLLTDMERTAATVGAQVEPHLGDGIVATFGATQIHEDDAERAVRVALQIREMASTARVAVSSGIHTGRVYVGAEGGDGQSPSVLGPVVNMAARLRDVAEEGEILIGQPTYNLTRLSVRATRRTISVPGQTASVAVYAVTRTRRRPRRTRGIEGLRAKLVGRSHEMERLREMLAALQSGTGGVVLLTGDAGVGKSRLVAEFEELAHETREPPLWLEGRCLEMTTVSAYAPFVSLLRGYVETSAGQQRTPANELHRVLDSLVDSGLLTGEQREETGPLLGRLLGFRFGDAWDAALSAADPQQIQYRTSVALNGFLAALARRQPLIVVLEDLHWADDLSIDLAIELFALAGQCPILLVCAFRPDQQHRSHQLAGIAARSCPANWAELKLAALTPNQTRNLISSLLDDAEPEQAVFDRILARAQGNPFFAEEIVRSFLENGAIYRKGRTWRLRPDAPVDTIPAGVNSVVLSRVDRLPPAQRDILRHAAVIGRTFALPLLARLSANRDLAGSLEELEEHGFLYLERSLPAPEYSFWHVLTQQAVYGTLPRSERAGIHGQVAAAMEVVYADTLDEHVVELAYHYDRTDNADKAITYLLKAGEKLRRDYAGDSAISHFQRALKRLDELESPASDQGPQTLVKRYGALKGLGLTYSGRSRLEDAEVALRKALELARQLDLSPTEQVGLIAGLCEVLSWQVDHEELPRLVQEAFDLLPPESATVERAMMNHHAWHSGEYYRSLSWLSSEHLKDNARILADLPYTDELRPAYFSTLSLCLNQKDLAA